MKSIAKHPKKENLHFKIDFLINFTHSGKGIPFWNLKRYSIGFKQGKMVVLSQPQQK
jgi:hypothetical protein